jgi:hypothetical protein
MNIGAMRLKNLSIKFGAGILLTGIVLLILGISRGEAGIVFERAIRVCLGCIGIE